ncbi:MAG: Holliday junction branch migration protein RuvA [Phototrophicales bacterium]|nr:Holliday junction branch migration protein RuvA [Phototrophicales bacterium]
MIASLQGKIGAIYEDSLVLVVSGVGYKVFVPAIKTSHSNGDDLFLHTLMIVREDALSLYGFYAPADRSLFEVLLTVSGVGPKVALSILATVNGDNLRTAVLGNREEILTRVPGIGKKTAQKIIFELKDKLSKGLDTAPVTVFDDINSDVIDALVAMDFSIIEAQTAIQSFPPDAPQDIGERLRLALQYLGG